MPQKETASPASTGFTDAPNWHLIISQCPLFPPPAYCIWGLGWAYRDQRTSSSQGLRACLLARIFANSCRGAERGPWPSLNKFMKKMHILVIFPFPREFLLVLTRIVALRSTFTPTVSSQWFEPIPTMVIEIFMLSLVNFGSGLSFEINLLEAQTNSLNECSPYSSKSAVRNEELRGNPPNLSLPWLHK